MSHLVDTAVALARGQALEAGWCKCESCGADIRWDYLCGSCRSARRAAPNSDEQLTEILADVFPGELSDSEIDEILSHAKSRAAKDGSVCDASYVEDAACRGGEIGEVK